LQVLYRPEDFGLRRGTREFDAVAEALLQLARRLHALRHDNIVQLRGVTMHPEHGHVQWLVTERADVGSLESWLSTRGRVTVKELVHLLVCVLQAIGYLDSCVPAVLHGDIKPANILAFTAFGGGIVWRLGDVGVARVLQSTLRTGIAADAVMYTAADVLMGPCDGKADVFSAGIMAAELVVRYMDIEGFERVSATAYRTPIERPALVRDACKRLKSVCPDLESVVRRCCAKTPGARMSSNEAVEALKDISVSELPLLMCLFFDTGTDVTLCALRVRPRTRTRTRIRTRTWTRS
jgi:serine/threonine protein kinase